MTAQREHWLGAQAFVDGKPLLVRSRDPAKTPTDPALPHLLVVELDYAIQDDSALPSERDYDQFEEFEAALFSVANSNEIRLVFVETGSGLVRYFCYTSNVDRAIDLVEAAPSPLFSLSFQTILDASWDEFHSRASKLQ